MRGCLHEEGLLLRKKNKIKKGCFTTSNLTRSLHLVLNIKTFTNLHQSLLLKHSLTFPGVANLIDNPYFAVWNQVQCMLWSVKDPFRTERKKKKKSLLSKEFNTSASLNPQSSRSRWSSFSLAGWLKPGLSKRQLLVIPWHHVDWKAQKASKTPKSTWHSANETWHQDGRFGHHPLAYHSGYFQKKATLGRL